MFATEDREIADGGDLLHAGLGEERERQNPLAAQRGRSGIRDVVGEETGVAAEGAAAGAAVLPRGGLHERVERATIAGNREALKALVVFATGGGLAW